MKSIAVVGASKNTEKFSNKCIRAYLSIGWKVYPVNPRENEIEGQKCFASVKEIHSKPDIVSVYLPSNITRTIISDFVAVGIKEIILNPGAESDELISELKAVGIKPLLVCSIRLQGLFPGNF
ncbi:MAG: CoA-binding protein [Candidatus Diapherotrites archaeon CG11_big_fil_rev_8_21_14_0_20_37_9]|nr:MAG: CoA-binding protein [Candidatus Diapherotrites archaeon CG11_big_fil_rev_8_21_14_0_20_37_9]